MHVCIPGCDMDQDGYALLLMIQLLSLDNIIASEYSCLYLNTVSTMTMNHDPNSLLIGDKERGIG